MCRLVTGQSAEQWTGVQVGHAEMHVTNAVPCQRIAAFCSSGAGVRSQTRRSLGVQLIGSSSDATASRLLRQLQEKYASILSAASHTRSSRTCARWLGWARVHVGAESRTSAEKLCANLRAAGASCLVQRY
jgi:hypothetical protein